MVWTLRSAAERLDLAAQAEVAKRTKEDLRHDRGCSSLTRVSRSSKLSLARSVSIFPARSHGVRMQWDYVTTRPA